MGDDSTTAVANETALDEDTVEVHEALTELIKIYQFRDRDRICCFDISVTQCYALKVIVNRDGLSLNDVAASLYLDKSTTSRVVDALVTKGYVRRLAHPTDGRALLLRATDGGKELLGRIEEGILAEERDLLARFSPEVRRAMADMMRRLARAAISRSGVRPGQCGVPG